MDYKELDEYVSKYGFDNTTDIDDMKIAMMVNKSRKDKENGRNTV